MNHTLDQQNRFSLKHIGPSKQDISKMLEEFGYDSIDAFINRIVPDSIKLSKTLALPTAATEIDALKEITEVAKQNVVTRNLIGQGYYGCFLPSVIKRTILENPGWYTQYTPYQAEIAQGRLEALFNFQSAVSELTDLPIANASLLDEGTAAAEAIAMSWSLKKKKTNKVLIDRNLFPQTISVIKTRANSMGIEVDVDCVLDSDQFDNYFAMVVQNRTNMGDVPNYTQTCDLARNKQCATIVCCDPLSLTLYKSPGEQGFDIAVGSFQRFGLPMGNGGPHAAFISCNEKYVRKMPGRIVGQSLDVRGNKAYRLALQTREQHIRREKATSNICTSQVLLAVLSSMYCMYHGEDGLVEQAQFLRQRTQKLAQAIKAKHRVDQVEVFDTITVFLDHSSRLEVLQKLRTQNFVVRQNLDSITLSLDELTDQSELIELAKCFGVDIDFQSPVSQVEPELKRGSRPLRSEVFHRNLSETEMLRYIKSLESKDLSLTHSMIPLGSCTMKLNAASELYPISFPEFANIHPFAPKEDKKGYKKLTDSLATWLSEITGLCGVSLQPNSGAQGEYAGLLSIKKVLINKNQGHRNICLIPKSAHGTNPASATMCGFKVVAIDCDERGNISAENLRVKIAKNRDNLACIMITYPSTHGVFEEGVKEICSSVHQAGGYVYMDGANMNAQVGLCRPGDFGVDVCHLNLHKTFCIPHGGGGPGVGPICTTAELEPFLPQEPDSDNGYSVSAANYGSASILPISWMYIRMMGPDGLKLASQVAILSANYMAAKLKKHYPILYTDKNGLVAHECIIDLRGFRVTASVEVEDIAKRLMDYGFHAPTMSWPVPHTMMIEPTESESLAEIDRFCDAMISIKNEIDQIVDSNSKSDNLLKNAPHTLDDLIDEKWERPYSRAEAFFPRPWVKSSKFWPSCARVDNAYGDRNLVCTCEGMENYS
jgi:glycine dehydrogenase